MPHSDRDLEAARAGSRWRQLSGVFFITTLIIAFVIAIEPAPELVQVVAAQDKVLHALVFFAITLLGLFAWPRRAFRLTAVMLVYGVAMEIAQSFVPERMADPWDWLADAIGVACAVLAHRALDRPS